jgi:hypothetical protein
MQAATGIFLNGIFGVFVGLTVVYIAIKLIKFAAPRQPEKKEE